ncbi:CotH kinase family protein [Arthrobacter alpinus]|nr:CotH kinase family protein [Arthrobacter alpinus]
MANSDDMAGPGQNYYLSYNLTTKKISVISWDLNLALSGNATASPDDSMSMGGGKGGGGMGGNALKTRFLASTKFQTLYKSAYQELYQQVFNDGTAQSLLTTITASIPASDGLSQEDITDKSATIATFLKQRGDALAKALAG